MTLPLIIYDNATGTIYGTGANFPDAADDASQRVDPDDTYMVREARAHDAGRWSSLAGVAGRLARNPWRWVSATPELVTAVRAPDGQGGKVTWSIVNGVATLS
jgi:hypothetical protein